MDMVTYLGLANDPNVPCHEKNIMMKLSLPTGLNIPRHCGMGLEPSVMHNTDALCFKCIEGCVALDITDNFCKDFETEFEFVVFHESICIHLTLIHDFYISATGSFCFV